MAQAICSAASSAKSSHPSSLTMGYGGECPDRGMQLLLCPPCYTGTKDSSRKLMLALSWPNHDALPTMMHSEVPMPQVGLRAS